MPRSWNRPTGRGLALAGLGGALVIVAWSLREPTLVWPGLFLLFLPLVCFVGVLIGHPRLEIRRTIQPEEVAAGSPVRIDLELVAARAAIASTLTVEDHMPRSFGADHRFALPVQRRGQLTREAYARRPRRRGRFTLAGAAYHYRDPLGLATGTVRVPASTPVVVTPMVLPLGAADTSAFGRTGETPIPHTAFAGADDVLVREYRPRDDVRRIHWPSTARTGTLMVRREEQAWDPSAWLVLDSRASSFTGSGGAARFEWLVTVAASVGVELLAEGYDLSATDARGETFVSHASLTGARAHPERAWLHHLVDAAPVGEDRLEAAVHELAQNPSGHLVVALLGRLTPDDTRQLVTAGDSHQQCRALYVPADEADPEGVQGEKEAVAIMEGHGWVCVGVPVGCDLASAWSRCGGAARGFGR